MPDKPLHSSSTSGKPPAPGVFVARNRRAWLLRKVAGACRWYTGWYENVNYDLETNGEATLLDRVAASKPAVIFDVGANVGEWSLAMHQRCPLARIYAFEIAPRTFGTLQANIAGRAGIQAVNAGLSDSPGTLTINEYEDVPSLTTAIDYPHPYASRRIEAQVITGDDFARSNGIEHIDMLKIDVEGMEGNVLRGFSEMFRRGAIDVVQFEYGRASIFTHVLLRDLCSFLNERGYVVGKLYPTYVDFRDYNLADENFWGPNYVACRIDRQDYIEALSGRTRTPQPPRRLAATAKAGVSANKGTAWRETLGFMRADHRRLVQALRDAGDSGRRSALTHHSFICAALYRLSRHCFLNGHKYLSRLFWHLNAIVTGADIPGQADLGPGLLVPTPAGIAIAGRAGRNFTPMALTGLGSELGRREDVGAGPGLPVVGDDVTIEPHGGILGPIRVGNGVRVTAGVFLVRDAPDFAVARAGAPRFLGRRDL